MDLKTYLKKIIRRVDKILVRILTRKGIPKSIINGAKYSVFSGGKRIRPALLIASCEAVGGNTEKSLNAACAIELIHTYSLIHDDLPAMDDDDLRRGKATLHKVIGEGNAILVGDALLTLAFEILATDNLLSARKKIQLIAELGKASGMAGMIGGQAMDIASEGKKINLKTLQYIHSHKTGALITASCRMGAIIGNANKKAFNFISEYGKNIGLAFQITDDILNVIGDKSRTGKAVGSDDRRKKATYPSLFGVEKSIIKAKKHVETAIRNIEIFGHKAIPLKLIASNILNRTS